MRSSRVVPRIGQIGSGLFACCVSFAVAFAASCSTSESTPKYSTTVTTPSKVLRAEVVGCWALSDGLESFALREPGWSPPVARLEASTVGGESTSGTRWVVRLDTLQQAMPPSRESLSTGQSTWSADAESDSIRITFNNGLYGSHWVLAVQRAPATGDSIHGERQDFSDADELDDGAKHRVKHGAHAVRIACVAP